MIAVDRLAWFGAWTVVQLDRIGQGALFTLATLRALVVGTGPTGRFRLLLPQLYAIGTRSVPVIVLVGTFVGAVLGVESFAQFEALGQEARLGAVINISVVRQIGPVLAAVMIAGRVGGSVAAELGTMRVTEQIDALRVMGADPVAYLVAPRVLACLIMLPVLTVVSDLMGILGGYLVVVVALGVEPAQYWTYSSEFVKPWDVSTGLIKSFFFGAAIGLISCFKGFHCNAGAAGVGRAATDAFVSSFIAIIVINFVLAKFLRDLYIAIYGDAGTTFIG
ncbi:MAG: ABC transporter permease [Planctomycetota bacterium]